MTSDFSRAAFEPTDPQKIAARLIRERFDGCVPETFSPQECVELMVKFAEFQTAVANSYERIARAATAQLLPAPVIIQKPGSRTP